MSKTTEETQTAETSRTATPTRSFRPRRAAVVGFGLFGLLFSLSLIAGWHINLSYPAEEGGSIGASLDPLTAFDAVAIVLLTLVAGTVAFLVFRLAGNRVSWRGNAREY